MEHYGKESPVYKGIWVAFVFMFLFPLAAYILLHWAFGRYFEYPDDILTSVSLAFAGLIGVLFILSCWVAGFLNGFMRHMFKRIYRLFADFKIFKGEAVQWYFEDFVRNGGFIIWAFFLVLATYIVITSIGFYNFFSWYNASAK